MPCFDVMGHILCLARNPVKISLLDQEKQAVEGFCKTIENKENFSSCLAFSQHTICEFRLVLLDHNTFDFKPKGPYAKKMLDLI